MLDALGMSQVEVDALGEAIACAAADVDRATHTLLTQIRAFDELRGWHQHGALSCAHWLSWRCGIALGPAREKVRVAHRLAELPRIDAAMRDGELSYSKARAITRVAAPETEAELLDMARAAPAAQLEKICRLFRSVQRQSAAAARADERKRWVRTRHLDDGMVRVEAQLEPDEAALVMTAIRGASNNRADGLVAIAEAAARGDKPQRAPVEVTLTIDAETLAGRLDDGSGISAETCRRLCCDAGLVPVITDEHGATLDVGRKTRTIPPSLRRALVLRDGGCQFPGCTNTLCDAHHLDHWIDGGATSLENTLLACRRHHRYLHEYGFTVARTEDGAFEFRDPNGELVPTTGAAPPHTYRPRPTLRVPALLPRWDGQPTDYSAAIDVLVQRAGLDAPPERRPGCAEAPVGD